MSLIDQDWLATHIMGLSVQNFKRTVRFLLENFFHLKAVDVDGAGDGGSDWQVFGADGTKRTVAYQDTAISRDNNWKMKGLADARKAVKQLGATRYFYVTKQKRQATDIRSLENEVFKDLSIPAVCLGAIEISGILIDSRLLSKYLDFIGYHPLPQIGERPDRLSMLVYSYRNFSKEVRSHQDEIYEDTLLFASYQSGLCEEGQLIGTALSMLGLSDGKYAKLKSRLDALGASKKILRRDGGFVLSEESSESISQGLKIYLQEMAALEIEQRDYFKSSFQIEWSKSDSEYISYLLGKLFTANQIESIENSKADIIKNQFIQELGDPAQGIREFLHKKGLTHPQVKRCLLDLEDQAKDSALIKKMCRSATYLCLEGGSPLAAAKAIGAGSWNQVKILIETSVAMPYLCSSLYVVSPQSFFLNSFDAIKKYQDLGAKVFINDQYLDEAASHFLEAKKYVGLDDYANDLRYSQNAYISNYYQLKLKGVVLPENTLAYLSAFSQRIREDFVDFQMQKRKVMADFGELFSRYGVRHEPSVTLRPDEIRDMEEKYSYFQRDQPNRKSETLVHHDIVTLKTLEVLLSKGEHWMVFTWDKSLIGFSKEVSHKAYILSPDRAIDFISPYFMLSDNKLCSISHIIASARDKAPELSAKVVDRIVKYGSERLQDWQFRERFDLFRKELIESIDFEDPGHLKNVYQKTNAFMKDEGIPHQSSGPQ